MTPLINFWLEFRNAFTQEIELLSDDELVHAWESSTNRTRLYENKVLKKVANRLRLEYKIEDFKIDYTLCISMENGYKVPLVFIESENIAHSAHHEIRKLCCLNAPLKVLITCVEWSDEPGFWPNGGAKKTLVTEWKKQIRNHTSVWPNPAITGVIVGEWNKSLRFYCLAFNQLGKIADKHHIIFEREIS